MAAQVAGCKAAPALGDWRAGRDSGRRARGKASQRLPSDWKLRHVQSADRNRRDAWPDHGQGRPGHARARTGILGAGAFLGLQSRQALVAQARTRDRPLLLVPGAVVHARLPDRAVGARRQPAVRDSRCRRPDCLLRQRPWPAVDAAPVAAGDPVPGRCRFHDVLAAPHVPWRRVLAIPRHPPFVRGCGLDFRGALSPGEPAARNHRGRRRAADGRDFAECDALARTVQYLPFGVRPRQFELEAGSVQICGGDAGVPPLASHLAGRRRRHQFRRHLSALGHPVRDLPDARKSPAGQLRCRRSVVIPARNYRAAGYPFRK